MTLEEEIKQEKLENNKSVKNVPSVLPKTGSNDFILKLLSKISNLF